MALRHRRKEGFKHDNKQQLKDRGIEVSSIEVLLPSSLSFGFVLRHRPHNISIECSREGRMSSKVLRVVFRVEREFRGEPA
jgi:RNA:NAD 2'-phosphotransferase (TPT1/KptA family)